MRGLTRSRAWRYGKTWPPLAMANHLNFSLLTPLMSRAFARYKGRLKRLTLLTVPLPRRSAKDSIDLCLQTDSHSQQVIIDLEKISTCWRLE